MATTTTNFGWDIPQSTDLVKDGATAIAALGQDIDTAFVDLKGGTTGQVLAKASATDLDYSWTTPQVGDITAVTAGTGITGGGTSGDVTITNSMATAIDAKGDLIVGTGADAFSRLAAGNNGETVVADSTASTGLRYQSGYNSNGLINGGMDIFQRSSTPTTGLAVTSTSTSFYGLDRWQIFSASTGRTVSRQVTGDTTNLPNIQYCQRIARDSGNTNTAAILPAYSMESADAIRFAGQLVTLSFWARSGANYSATSNALSFTLRTGTGTDQNLNAGYTGSADPISSTATLTTTWQRFYGNATLASTVTELGVQFNFTPTGTAGAADFVEITGVQIELGAIPTSFKRSTGTIQGELAACQRYYQRITVQDSGGRMSGTTPAANTTNVYAIVQHGVQFRIAPTSIDYSLVGIADGVNAIITPSSYAINNAGVNFSVLAIGATGLTQYRNYFLIANSSTSAYLGFSAEL